MRKVLALLVMIASIFAMTACGGANGASSKNVSSLEGEWRQVNSTFNGWMTASISGGSIQVNMRGRDSNSVYWMGTFNTNKKSVGKFKVVSLGDQDAMKWEITASTDSRKTFTYNNGDLSFEFSALGSTTIIHMTKTKSLRASTPAFNRPTIRNIPKTKIPTIRRTPKAVAPKVVSPPKISTGKK